MVRNTQPAPTPLDRSHAGLPSADLRLGAFPGTCSAVGCTAVPIHDPHSGRILGVLDVTGSTRWRPAGVGDGPGHRHGGRTMAGDPATCGQRRAARPRQGPGTVEPRRPSGETQRPALRLLLLLLATSPQGLSGDDSRSCCTNTTPRSSLCARRWHGCARSWGRVLQSRPYRLTESMRTDAQEVLDALDRGDARVPSCCTPVRCCRVRRPRRSRRCAPTCGPACGGLRWPPAIEALMQFAVGEDGRDDVEVIQAALDTLRRPRPNGSVSWLGWTGCTNCWRCRCPGCRASEVTQVTFLQP